MKNKEWDIKIVADTNDADYVTEISNISDKDLTKIKPLIAAIKAFKPYKTKSDSGLNWTHDNNYPCGEHCPREDLGEKYPQEIYKGLDEEVFEIFEDLIPRGEYGIHTIKSIEIAPHIKWEKLL
ncbi:hypothetical protein C4577_06520 [Candidatus Parcubacteria bacterium]|nr:MAG: hypothetical protein C4577_06520 [Candidatus Parcubacteria bacterium]